MSNFKYLFLIVLCFAASAVAQVSTANVAGVVEDSTNARLPDASVKLINSQTGTENDSTTNHYGVFLLSGVIPGNYILQIERDGFATAQFTGITLNIGDSKQFLIRMEIGSVKQTVTIDAADMTLNTTDAAVSTVVGRKFVENIPLNGRSFQDLISMTPGIVTESPQAEGQFGGGHGDFSVNGQRPDSNAYTVDGVSGNIGPGVLTVQRKLPSAGNLAGTTALGTTQSLVSVDALQEFRVLGSTYSAEYGRTPGGQFTLLTRSGTNVIHGSAYDYLRNNIFDAPDWFNHFYLAPVDVSFRQNDFGGTLGAPIVLPRLYDGRNRTFFFLSYEGLRVLQPTAPLVQYVPSIEIRKDAPTALQPVLNAFPVPAEPLTIGAPTDATGLTAATYAAESWPSHINSTSLRLDHNFSSKLSNFFRYGDTPSDSQSRSLSSLTTNDVHNRTFTLGLTAQLSPTMSDEFRIGYARSNSLLNTAIDNYYRYSISPTVDYHPDLNAYLGIPGSYSSARAEAYIHIPGLGESAINTDDATSSLHQWNVRNTFNLQAAHHLISLGIDERHIVSSLHPPAVSIEADFFDQASILNNLASDITITKSGPATPVFNEFSAFAQDEWRISKALTLSLGLRWEVDPPPSEENGRDAYTVLGNVASPGTLKLAPRGTPLWHTSWYNLAPRVGAAWMVDKRPGKEVIFRAGGGVFFDTDNQAAAGAFNAVGFSASTHVSNASIPVPAAQFDFSATPVAPYTNTTAFAFPPQLQLPYTFQWNLAVDKALGRDQALTVSYVGAAGRRLLQSQLMDVRHENPNLGEVYYFPENITSNYQALQVKFQRSISPELQILSSYTLSHTLGYGSTDAIYPLTYGTSDFDVRHNFQAALSWNAPKLSGGWIRRNLLTGWGADGRLIARTAFPVTPLGNLFSDPVTGNRYYSGVDIVPGQPLYLYGPEYPGGRMFNGGPGVVNPGFRLPNGTAAGNAPLNMLRGFGDEQVNVAVRREIHLSDSLSLQLRAETFNLLNHPDLGYINPYLTDQLFGQSTLMLNQSFGPTGSLYQQGGPRSLQFMLKVVF